MISIRTIDGFTYLVCFLHCWQRAFQWFKKMALPVLKVRKITSKSFWWQQCLMSFRLKDHRICIPLWWCNLGKILVPIYIFQTKKYLLLLNLAAYACLHAKFFFWSINSLLKVELSCAQGTFFNKIYIFSKVSSIVFKVFLIVFV